MNAMAHLGMRWTGAGHRIDGRKVLIAENLDSHHQWTIDPVTGIGEPVRDPVATSARSASPAVPAQAQPSRKVRQLRADESNPRRAAPAGPAQCEHCGAKSVYQIRFSQNEFITKCLSCKRFVVDGRVERPGRSRSVARKGASLWLPLE